MVTLANFSIEQKGEREEEMRKTSMRTRPEPGHASWWVFSSLVRCVIIPICE